MSQSRIPNSIVLFLKCHGSESGNLVNRLSMFYENKTECVNDLQENVKITLSSAASVGSFFSAGITNKIGSKLPFKIAYKDSPIMTSSIYFNEFKDDYKKEVEDKVTDNFLITYYLTTYNEEYKTMNDIFQLISKIDFQYPELVIEYLKNNIKTIGFDNPKIAEINNDKIINFYNDLFIYLFFCYIIQDKKIVTNNNPLINLYNDCELAAINEMIQFYCIDNANHKITDAMYYHSRLMIKHIFQSTIDNTWTTEKIQQYKDDIVKGKITEEEIERNKRILIFADKDNEKIVDVNIDEHSMNRTMKFAPAINERKNWRTYGAHIIKAYHNGNTFCSAINDYTTEQYKDGEDYSALDNKNQYLLSKHNPFIQNIMKNDLDFIVYINQIFDYLDKGKNCNLHEIILLCKKLGFEKIYITDTSCRPNYDKDSLNIAMRPSNANLTQTNEFFIDPDYDPKVGDMVNFALPGQFNRNGKEKWSQQPGKIVDMTTDEAGNPINYIVNTSTNYSGVKVIKRLESQAEATHSALQDNWDNWLTEAEATTTLYQFIIPETETWSSRPGRIIQEYENSTGTSYDIEVPGETFENVLKVEDFIKMRSWVGGKKKRRNGTRRKQRSNKKQHKKRTKRIIR